MVNLNLQEYILEKELNLNEYFIIHNLTEEVVEKYDEVCELLALSDSLLSSNIEPDSIISSQCNKYSGCPFLTYCKKYKRMLKY